MSNPEDTKTMRSLIEAANMITNPTTLVRHPWLTEEEFGEAIAEAKHVGNRPTTGVPAGASKGDHEKARKANPFKVSLGKGVPAGAGAKKEEFEEEDELGEAVTPPDLILKAAVSTALVAGIAATNFAKVAHAAYQSTLEAQRVGGDDDADLEALDAAKATMESAKKALNKAVAAYEAAVKAYSHR